MPLSAILAIAGICATASVLAIPPADTIDVVTGRTATAATPAGDRVRVQQQATANLEAVGTEVSSVLSVVEIVASTAVK